MATTETKKDIRPISRTNFGLAVHRFSVHDCEVPGTLSKEDLTDPKLYENIARSVRANDEIRVVADDYSFVAYLHVTYAVGNQLQAKVTRFAVLDTVDYDSAQPGSSYDVKLRGPKKWCIVQKSNGDVVREGIATQAAAYKELEELQRALAS